MPYLSFIGTSLDTVNILLAFFMFSFTPTNNSLPWNPQRRCVISHLGSEMKRCLEIHLLRNLANHPCPAYTFAVRPSTTPRHVSRSRACRGRITYSSGPIMRFFCIVKKISLPTTRSMLRVIA